MENQEVTLDDFFAHYAGLTFEEFEKRLGGLTLEEIDANPLR
ncbi:hypothetical protein GCM10011374_03250 [Kocuria dechangensis]|uniref:Uncharacterized protein n=1 Tax=Kocuria dechangensis TaxID=1176249 RepID=A0A917GGN0_9MICC|nr:hypothetical protein [Kocuria dechangensis]GGG44286.1 hypothetical protein GCM10011374_03250 [Kocuria dechangensis]